MPLCLRSLQYITSKPIHRTGAELHAYENCIQAKPSSPLVTEGPLTAFLPEKGRPSRMSSRNP